MNRDFKDTVVVLVGQVGRLALALLAALVVARVLGPEGLGVYTLGMAIAGVCLALTEPGLRVVTGKDIAVALRHGATRSAAESAQRYLGLRLLLACPISLGAFGAAFAWLPQIDGLNKAAASVAVACVVLSSVLGQHAQALPEMSSAFKTSALLVVGTSVGRAGALLLLAMLGLLTPTTVLSVEAAAGALALLLLAVLLKSPLQGALVPRWDGLLQLLARSRWLAVGVVMGLVVMRVDVLALSTGAGAAEVGIYGLAATLASRAEVMKNSVLTVWYPRISASRGGELLAAVAGARSTGVKMSALLVPYAGVALAALAFGAGPEYHDALVPLMFLLSAGLVQLLVEPESLVLYAHWPRAVAVGDTMLALIATAGALKAAPESGAAGVAAVMALSKAAVGLGKVLAARWWVSSQR